MDFYLILVTKKRLLEHKAGQRSLTDNQGICLVPGLGFDAWTAGIGMARAIMTDICKAFPGADTHQRMLL